MWPPWQPGGPHLRAAGRRRPCSSLGPDASTLQREKLGGLLPELQTPRPQPRTAPFPRPAAHTTRHCVRPETQARASAAAEGAARAAGVCGGGGAHQLERRSRPGPGAARLDCREKCQRRRQADAQGLSARCGTESFTGERRAEEGHSSLGLWMYTKDSPMPLWAIDGARRRSVAASLRLRGSPYTARPRSLSKTEGAAGREAARRGLPRPALGSIHTYADFSCILICYLKCKEGERETLDSWPAVRLGELRRASGMGTLCRRAGTRSRSVGAECTEDVTISRSVTWKEAGRAASMVPGLADETRWPRREAGTPRGGKGGPSPSLPC